MGIRVLLQRIRSPFVAKLICVSAVGCALLRVAFHSAWRLCLSVDTLSLKWVRAFRVSFCVCPYGSLTMWRPDTYEQRRRSDTVIAQMSGRGSVMCVFGVLACKYRLL